MKGKSLKKHSPSIKVEILINKNIQTCDFIIEKPFNVELSYSENSLIPNVVHISIRMLNAIDDWLIMASWCVSSTFFHVTGQHSQASSDMSSAKLFIIVHHFFTESLPASLFLPSMLIYVRDDSMFNSRHVTTNKSVNHIIYYVLCMLNS